MVVVSLARLRRALVWVCVVALLGAVVRWGMRAASADPLTHGGAAISRLQVAGRAIALTFDGSGTDLEALAASLGASSLPATIFVTGAFALAQPHTVGDLTRAGLEVETVGWDGGDLTGQSAATLEASLQRSAARLTADTGNAALFLRPPAGHYNAATLRAAERVGLGVVTWTSAVDGRQSTAVVDQVLAGLRPGAILRLPVTPASVAAIPQIAVGLRMRGYEALTLQALLAMAEGAAEVSLRSTP